MVVTTSQYVRSMSVIQIVLTMTPQAFWRIIISLVKKKQNHFVTNGMPDTCMSHDLFILPLPLGFCVWVLSQCGAGGPGYLRENSDKRVQMKAEGICGWGDSQIWKVEDTLPKSQRGPTLLKGVNLSETVSVCLLATFNVAELHSSVWIVMSLPSMSWFSLFVYLRELWWAAAVPSGLAVSITQHLQLLQLLWKVPGRRFLVCSLQLHLCAAGSFILLFHHLVFLLPFIRTVLSH